LNDILLYLVANIEYIITKEKKLKKKEDSRNRRRYI